MAVVIAGCGVQKAAPALSEMEARALVCELPAVKAFFARTVQQSRGSAHGMVMTESTTGDRVDFYVGEDHADHTVCWNRFWVDRRTLQVHADDPD